MIAAESDDARPSPPRSKGMGEQRKAKLIHCVALHALYDSQILLYSTQ